MNVDVTQLIGSLVAIVLSIGLTGWVYKVLSKIIEELKWEIAQLEKQIEQLKHARCDKFDCKNRIPPCK